MPQALAQGCNWHTCQRGMSIFEVLAALVIAAVLASAIPQFAEMSASVAKSVAVKQLQADLRRARAAAISSGGRTVLDVAPLGASYSVGIDEAPYNNPAAPDRASFVTPLPSGITLSASADVVFDPRGMAIDSDGTPVQVSFSLADDTGTFGAGILYASGFFRTESP